MFRHQKIVRRFQDLTFTEYIAGIMSHDVLDFEKEVLEESRTTPVVVDFWAPWCGPCRFLGPVLEKLAAEADGRWLLRKVNTDALPELSMRYGIRGIPAVKLFVGANVVDEFTGALPEAAVRKWLDKALPSEVKKLLDDAESATRRGDYPAAEAALRSALASEPTNDGARVQLARLILFRDPEQAEELIEASAFSGPGLLQVEESVRTLGRLLRLANDPAAFPEEPGAERYRQAVAALSREDFDAAITAFIDVISANRYYDDDGARKACVAIFVILGESHPVTKKHRRAFDMALY